MLYHSPDLKEWRPSHTLSAFDTFHSLILILTVFLSGSYDFCFIDLSTAQSMFGPLVMFGNFDGSPINKHHNTGPTDQQNLAVH